MTDIDRVIYRETMPELKHNIDIGDGVRAVVDEIDGDVITVFAATGPMGETLRLRVITLSTEQRAFVDLVRNSMITGFLHLTHRLDEVREASATCGPNESAHDVLSRVLGEEPASFIAVRPFEVVEILEKLGVEPLPSGS